MADFEDNGGDEQCVDQECEEETEMIENKPYFDFDFSILQQHTKKLSSKYILYLINPPAEAKKLLENVQKIKIDGISMSNIKHYTSLIVDKAKALIPLGDEYDELKSLCAPILARKFFDVQYDGISVNQRTRKICNSISAAFGPNESVINSKSVREITSNCQEFLVIIRQFQWKPPQDCPPEALHPAILYNLEEEKDDIYFPPTDTEEDKILEMQEKQFETPDSRQKGKKKASDQEFDMYEGESSSSSKKLTLEWLHGVCAEIFGGEQGMEDQILQMLENNNKDEVALQDNLLSFLGFEKFDLISDLMQNRADLLTQNYQSKMKSNNSGPQQPKQSSFLNTMTVTSKEQKEQQKLIAKHNKALEKKISDTAAKSEGMSGIDIWKMDRSEDLNKKYFNQQDKNIFSSGFISNKRGQITISDELLRSEPKTEEIFSSLPVEMGASRRQIQLPGLQAEEYIFPPPQQPEFVKKALATKEGLLEVSKVLPKWAQSAFYGFTHLNTIQTIVFDSAFKSSENLLICAPTGAGKTNIAALAILREISQNFKDGILDREAFKIIYIAPMKALVGEMVRSFSKRFGSLGLIVNEFSGDVQLSKKKVKSSSILVATPEKWDVITRKTSDMALISNVKCIIIDEIHLLNEDRGPVLESIVARTVRNIETTQQGCRLIGLSATLPNFYDVAQFLHVNPATGLHYFDASFRPVPLKQVFVGVVPPKPEKKDKDKDEEQNGEQKTSPRGGKDENFNSSGRGRKGRSEKNGGDDEKRKTLPDLQNEVCFQKVVESLQAGNQVLVFVHSRKGTVKLGKFIYERAIEEENLELFKPPKEIASSEKMNKLFQLRELKEYVPNGIGFHHAGILRNDRLNVEKLFGDGHIRVLVCTATLAWGVNLPAHTVIIKGTEMYDPANGGWTSLGFLDVMQIFGRAGRPQFDTSGEGIIITSQKELPIYLKYLHSQLPIESKFDKELINHLNAEVVSGTVTNLAEAISWLSYTYFFTRVQVSPITYGVTEAERVLDPTLTQFRKSLLVKAARVLHDCKMARFDVDNETFTPTELGRIASHYYIDYGTIELFNEQLSPDISEAQILDVVSSSREFKNITVREDETTELESLLANCPVKPSGSIQNEHTKVNVMIQHYITNTFIKEFSLVSDMNYVGQNVGRIVRALFEIALKKNWSALADKLLLLNKSIEQKIWRFNTPLRQFSKLMNLDTLNMIEHQGLSLQDLEEMPNREIDDILGHNGTGQHIKTKILPYLPKLELTAKVEPITQFVLRINLSILPKFKWSTQFHGESEPFWLFVEDDSSDSLYHCEWFLLKPNQMDKVTSLSFAIPLRHPNSDKAVKPPKYFQIRMVSDRWIGNESTIIIAYNDIILPENYMKFTDLLPLTPLNIKNALKNDDYYSLYAKTGIEFMNPIQTQVFNAVFHSDKNILIGAPTGSGKTMIAEMAALRLFNLNAQRPLEEKQIVIYIAPLKALVKERMQQWTEKFAKLGKKVIELTGDYTPDYKNMLDADIVISTPEKWDGTSRNWKQRSYVRSVGLMIMDEIHLLGADRGAILEIIVSRMRYISFTTGQAIRFLGLSTALANASDLGAWLGIESITSSEQEQGDFRGLYNFRSQVRPVPIQVHIQGFNGPKHYCPRMKTMNKPAFNCILKYSKNKPVLIFVSSRRQTRLTAEDLMSYCASSENLTQFAHFESNDELESTLYLVKDKDLKEALRVGIGLHHAGLVKSDREIVEDLFKSGKIQILIATATLAWGVNLPAHLVIIKGTEFFDKKLCGYVDYPITDLLQMIGRAGRPQFDIEATAMVFVEESKKNYYKKFLYEAFPVESSLQKDNVLADHINAEIVSGVIKSSQDAIDYLTWTFFFRRLVQNPTYYGLKSVSFDSLSEYLSKMIKNVIDDLQSAGMITTADEGLTPGANTSSSKAVATKNRIITSTALGMVASFYYMKYASVAAFNKMVNKNLSHLDLLTLVTDAKEFLELPVRHCEDEMDKEFSKTVRFPYKNEAAVDWDSSHVKANLLLQAHFEHKPESEYPVRDYVTDTKLVIDNIIRILQCFIDISAEKGYLDVVLKLMKIHQSVMQGMFWDDNPFYMFDFVKKRKKDPQSDQQEPDNFIKTIANRMGPNASLHELLKMDENEIRQKIGKSISESDMKHLITVVTTKLPVIEVNYKVEKVQEKENEIEINVNVVRKRGDGYNEAYAPRLSKKKDEGYWLVVGNTTKGELFALKRIRLGKNKSSAALHFPASESSENLSLMLVPDCYIGLEQQISLQLK